MRLPASAREHAALLVAPDLLPFPPPWCEDLAGPGIAVQRGDVRTVASGPFVRLTVAVPGARALSSATFRHRVADAYTAIGETLDALDRHPVRFWSFVPGIGDLVGPDLDRYMVFNAGRHDAYARWYGSGQAFGHSLATASAVGIAAEDLVVHCLAAAHPGSPVENPRQRPAWQYSTKYGPLPPCFSRATIVNLQEGRRLLIGGTASIVGEDSRHPGDLEAQLEETLKNLASVIAAARGNRASALAVLECLIDVRAYITAPESAATVHAALARYCSDRARIELRSASLCRPDLLVEIEGVAGI